MAVNRFTKVGWNQPISMYAPRPFEELYAVGQNMAKKHSEDEGKLGSLQKTFDDLGPLATHVLSEGDKNDPGLKYRETGYEEYKNKVIKDIQEEHLKLADDYSTGRMNTQDFTKRSNDITRKFSSEYNKLKLAAENTKAINKAAEELSKNQDHFGREHLLNELGAAGSRLLSNPWSSSYQAGAIGKAVNEEEEVNKSAQHYKEDLIKSGYGYKNPTTGMIEYRGKEGIVIGRVADEVNRTFDNTDMGKDAIQRVKRELNNRGYEWNTKAPDGKTNIGDYLYSKYKEDYKQAVIDKVVYQKEDLKIEKDWKYAADYQHKLDNDIVRFSTQGMGINPQTVEKSSSDLTNNISKFSDSISELNKLKSTLVENSPEWVNADAQVKWNEIQLKKRNEMKAKAEQVVNGKTTASDKALFNKFGEWDPSNFGDGNYSRLLKKYNLPSTSTVKELFEKMGGTLSDAAKLTGAYNRKNESIDKYLKSTSDNYTIQPNLITVDNTKDLKTSKAIEELYNHGNGSWQVFDENGPVPLDEQPKNLKIPQISEEPVDNLGYLFGGTEQIVDEQGHVTDGKKYYVRPTGEHNINEKIGKDLIDENSKKDTPQAISRYNMGLTMISPEFAHQVSEVREGTKRDIQSSNKIIGTVNKKNTAAGVTYTVSSPGYAPKTFGSEEEALLQLNALKRELNSKK